MSQHPKTKEIDWKEIHRRLDAVGARIEANFAPAGEEKKRILKARTRAFSRPPPPRASADSVLVVEFSLAYETYGMEVSYIREICPLRDITILPGVPHFMLGIINVRGEIVSVVDIKKFFDLPEKGLTDLNKVIILSGDEIEFGVLADAVLDVRSVPLGEIQPCPPTLTGIRADYLRGVTPERIVILDGARLLTDKRLIVHEEVT